jgi:hypothetical protein
MGPHHKRRIAMQYMIVILNDEKAAAKATVEQQKEVRSAYMKYTQELKAAGVLLAGEGLEPTSTGARITYKEGRRVVTDGPFSEAKEVVGGFYTIDVKNREEAVEWAGKCPGARFGTIELRSVMVMPK